MQLTQRPPDSGVATSHQLHLSGCGSNWHKIRKLVRLSMCVPGCKVYCQVGPREPGSECQGIPACHIRSTGKSSAKRHFNVTRIPDFDADLGTLMWPASKSLKHFHRRRSHSREARWLGPCSILMMDWRHESGAHWLWLSKLAAACPCLQAEERSVEGVHVETSCWSLQLREIRLGNLYETLSSLLR